MKLSPSFAHTNVNLYLNEARVPVWMVTLFNDGTPWTLNHEFDSVEQAAYTASKVLAAGEVNLTRWLDDRPQRNGYRYVTADQRDALILAMAENRAEAEAIAADEAMAIDARDEAVELAA